MPLSSIEDLSLAYGHNHFLIDRPLRDILRSYLGTDHSGDLDRLGEYCGREVYEASYRIDYSSRPELITWSVRGARADTVWLDPYERIVIEKLVSEYKINTHPFQGAPWHLHYTGIYLVGDPGISCILTITIQTAHALYKYGGPEVRDLYMNLSGMRNPPMWGATWFTEIQGGSDLGSNQTTAKNTNGTWRLNGYKYFASGAGLADIALATARYPGGPPGVKGLALYAVPRLNSRGELNFYVRRLKNKSGTIAVPTGEVEFIDSEAYLLGDVRHGIYYTLENLIVSRLANSIGAVGIARKAYLEAYLYANSRRAFGKPIIEHRLVQRDLLEMEIEIEAMLALTFKAIDLFNSVWKDKPPYSERYHYARLLTHIAKNMTAEASSWITQRSMEIYGGIGFLREYPVERWHREALITPIWEGTSNIQALDMVEAVVRKRAYGDLLEELKAVRSEAYSRDLASRAYELVEDSISTIVRGDSDQVEFLAKDLLRSIGYGVAILALQNISLRLNDETYDTVANLYYQMKVLGGLRRVPEPGVVDYILSLRQEL